MQDYQQALTCLDEGKQRQHLIRLQGWAEEGKPTLVQHWVAASLQREQRQAVAAATAVGR